MSTADSGAGRREVAYRMFAAEFDDADFSYSESDEERAPNYVITPTGARANRVFVVGVLTEIEEVSDDVLRARVVDPTGAFVLYAGQYQPDEQAFLETTEPPTFVAVTGKARTFSPDDSEQVFTSIRPESISEVDAETRDRWTVQAAEQTLDRIAWFGTALTLDGEGIEDELIARGADEGLAHGIELAIDHYGTTPAYLDAVREMAIDGARVVAGKKDEIEGHTVSPDTAGELTAAELLAKLPDTPAATEGTSTDETVAASSDTSTAESSQTTESADTPSDEASESESVETTAVESTGTTDGESAGIEEPDPVESKSESVEDEPPKATAGAETESATQSETTTDDDAEDALGDFEPDEEFELEAETRDEIEEEYGTEFQSGTEVDEPGNADIDTPEPESETETDESATEETTTTGGETDAEEETAVEGEPDGDEVPADEQPESTQPESSEPEADVAKDDSGETEPEDMQATVVELMSELDDGDGANREELIAEMENRYGTDTETVEEAIQSALMKGKCYEPNDTTLKPI